MSKRFLYAVTFVLFVGMLVPAPLSAEEATGKADISSQTVRNSSSSLESNWQFKVEMPDRCLHILVELHQKQDGTLDGTVLSPTDGVPGVLAGKETGERSLVLSGIVGSKSRQFLLRREGDALAGSFVSGGNSYPVSGTRIAVPKLPVSYKSMFNGIWNSVDRSFYDPQFRGVDWKAMRERYLPQATKAQTPGEFVRVVRAMLAELRVSHLDFYLEPDEGHTNRKSEPMVWKALSPKLGYLQIRTLESKDKEESDRFFVSLDKAMRELSQYPSLVLDLRGNLGGSIDTTTRVMDRFLPGATPIFYVSTRKGLKQLHANSLGEIGSSALPQIPSSEDNPTGAIHRVGSGALYAGGRMQSPYSGQIAVLVDYDCASGCEALAAALKERRGATMVGQRTRGALLGAVDTGFIKHGLIGKKLIPGWRLELPVMDFRTPEGMQIEGHGIEPDIATAKSSEKSELDRAVEVLSTPASQERAKAAK